jgi:single-stranded DNA-specific DHH superfamily exonuclease
MMLETGIHDFARQLLDAHGANAVAEAAQRAVTFEKERKTDEAEAWQRTEDDARPLRELIP